VLLAAGCQGPRSSASAQTIVDPLTAPAGSAPGDAVFPGPAASGEASGGLAVSGDAGPGDAASDAETEGALALGEADAGPDGGSEEADGGAASEPIAAGCHEQKAQAFLVRGNFFPPGDHPNEHHRSLTYRVKQYGTIGKLTPDGMRGNKARDLTQRTTFFGVPVHLHRKIIPALRCAEQEIQKSCRKVPYQPEALSGWRGKNTYRGGEVTNHLFGIAIDIDPHRNACCHCVEPWNRDPHCKDHKAPPEKHMEMPLCWVESFERFGFYWLGHDRLEDTMHFEFLGDPDQIVPPPKGTAAHGG
jgi:hypothetical protein